MKKAEFWMVELGVRMGPLVLGTEYESLLQVFRDHHIGSPLSFILTKIPRRGWESYRKQTRHQQFEWVFVAPVLER